MNKKGLIDCGSFSLWLVIIVFMIAFFIGLYVGFQVDEWKSSKKLNDIEYECPILLEQGNYLFIDGTLISPSGERLKCEEVGGKENE